MSCGARGKLQPDKTKFHNGVKAVADQIHGLGLKFGRVQWVYLLPFSPSDLSCHLFHCCLTGSGTVFTLICYICSCLPGLYGDSGLISCASFPGSQGCETQDVKQFAAWGVDYRKYDNCATPSGSSVPHYITRSNALITSGRTILYSLCNWGADSV